MQEEKSLTGLVGDLAGSLTTLFRTEVALAKAEVEEKSRQAVIAVGMVVAGGVLGLAALIVLLQALVVALTNAGIPAGWSALIVGVVVAIIGYVSVQKGVSSLRRTNLLPSRTVGEFRKDYQTAKEHV